MSYIYSEVEPSNATNETLTWSSSNPFVLEVNPDTGTVTALKSGTANITATAMDGSGKSSSITLSVLDNE